MKAGGGWLLEKSAADPATLHAPWPPDELADRRVVRRCEVTGPPSLVLGSGQGDDIVDTCALSGRGMQLVRRRSGGGAVVVAPGAQLWIDAWTPRRDPLWEDDIVTGAFWMGDTWAEALASLGVRGAVVHRRRATHTAWSALMCFAGMGPGEVSVQGRKVVGISQRRTRAGGRWQCLALARWEPSTLMGVLSTSSDDRQRAVADTADAVLGIDVLLPAMPDSDARFDALAAAFVSCLPDR